MKDTTIIFYHNQGAGATHARRHSSFSKLAKHPLPSYRNHMVVETFSRRLFNTIPTALLLKILSAFIFTLAFNLIFVRYGIQSLDHESVLFKPAVDLLESKVLFRDTFVQYGPLSVLFHALAIFFWGKRLLVVRCMTAVVYSFTAVFLFLIWRRFCTDRYALLSVMLWNLISFHVFYPYLAWASAYALFFQSAAAYFFLRGIDKKTFWPLLAAGACASGAFFCKQNVGAMLLLSLLCGLIVLYAGRYLSRSEIVKDTGALVAGAFAIFVAFVVWFVKTGALRDWWLQNFKWPIAWVDLCGEHFSVVFLYRCLFQRPDPSERIFVILPVACIFAALFFLRKLFRNTLSKSEIALLLTAIISLGSWSQYYPIPGVAHDWWAASLMMGVLMYILYHWKALRLRSPALPFVLGLILCSGTLIINYHRMRERLVRENTLVGGSSPFTGLRLEKKSAVFIGKVEETINLYVDRNRKGPSVILLGNDGVYMTFLNSPPSFHPIWSSEYHLAIERIYPDYFKKFDDYVDRELPSIFFSGKGTEGSNRLQAFQKRHPEYKIIANVDMSFFILRAKPLKYERDS